MEFALNCNDFVEHLNVAANMSGFSTGKVCDSSEFCNSMSVFGVSVSCSFNFRGSD